MSLIWKNSNGSRIRSLVFGDTVYTVGFIGSIIGCLLLILTLTAEKEEAGGVAALMCYLMSFVYWFVFLIDKWSRNDSYNNSYRLNPAFLLAFICGYTINHSSQYLGVFPGWFNILVVIICISHLLLPFLDLLHYLIKITVSAIMGVAVIVFLYLACCLFPDYGYGLFLFFLLGIPLLVFSPLVMLINIITWIIRHMDNKMMKYGFLSSLISVFCGIIIFMFQWNQTTVEINTTLRERSLEKTTSDLPKWIRVAQIIPENTITEWIMKTELEYISADELSENRGGFGSFLNEYHKEKQHNPLIVLSSFFSKSAKLSREERIKILKSSYDSRHYTTQRLWNGDEIRTTDINTSIQIWPQFRMAYTEQEIRLFNDKYWGRFGEGIYTFHLPEGSVVTSLSLWIDNEERKGILTTKEKADSAYQRIVGIEARDPSVVHWQEGSSVTVRVFPVISRESRKFKIGITSPLSEYGGHIKYKSVYFEGPDFSEATEQMTVRFMQPPQYADLPSFLTKENKNVYTQKGKYRNNWEIKMGKTAIESNGFCFNGNQYSIGPADNEIKPVHLPDVYLDLNSAWTKDEFETVYDCCKNRNIWVRKSFEMVKVTQQNREEIFKTMNRLNFSLFPLFEIQDPEHSILISKSTFTSPNMSDLENTDFLNSLIHSQSNGKVYFFNLGEELSPYLKTLLEFRKFNYQQGEIADLKTILLTNSFSIAKERDEHLIIHQSNISIQKNAKECDTSNAPDHIMRMFAYNHILRNYTNSLASNDSVLNKQIIHEAQESYVVSPVSSLIVLETQADYDRFRIQDIEKSIGNAGIQQEKKAPLGNLNALEWLIMGALAILTVYLFRKKNAI